MAGCLSGCWMDGGPDPDPATWVHHEEGCPNLAVSRLAEQLYVPLMKRWGYADGIIAQEGTRKDTIKKLVVYAEAFLDALRQAALFRPDAWLEAVANRRDKADAEFADHACQDVSDLLVEVFRLRAENTAARAQISKFLDLHQKQVNDLDGATMDTVASWLASYQLKLAALQQEAAMLRLNKPRVELKIDGPWVIDQIYKLKMPGHQQERLSSYANFIVQLCEAAIKAHEAPDTADELPFQTYERVYGLKWPGGKSETITVLLRTLGVTDPPGSEEANLRMQEILLRRAI